VPSSSLAKLVMESLKRVESGWVMFRYASVGIAISRIRAISPYRVHAKARPCSKRDITTSPVKPRQKCAKPLQRMHKNNRAVARFRPLAIALVRVYPQKIATSLDARRLLIADGTSQWITGRAGSRAPAEPHQMRAEHDAGHCRHRNRAGGRSIADARTPSVARRNSPCASWLIPAAERRTPHSRNTSVHFQVKVRPRGCGHGRPAGR